MFSGNKMRMARPKSSKGRSRPMMAQLQSVDTSAQHPVFSPQPPAKSNDRSNQCLRPHATVRQCRSQPGTEIQAEVFDRQPDEPVSLNRYRVLPSIDKKPTENVQRKDSQISQSGSSRRIFKHQCIPNVPTKAQSHAGVRNVSNSPRTTNRMSKVMPKVTGSKTDQMSGDEPELLLAIRNPCGQRFKCHFHPADRLQVVISNAEAEFGENYENCIIETMDVPRRTFTNLSMTLAQCGVPNKSLLCISQADNNTDLT